MADRAATPPAPNAPDADVDDDRWFDLERTLAFSDAVIAVAITLLVVTLEVPDVASKDLGNALEDLEPTILAFVISFWLIAGFWIQHHQFARRLTAIDRGLMRINLLFLFCISLISFGQDLFGSYSDNVLALTVYTVILVAVGWSMYLLWRYSDQHGLLKGGAPPEEQDRQIVVLRSAIFFSAIPLGLVTPWAPLIWILNARVNTISRGLDRLLGRR